MTATPCAPSSKPSAPRSSFPRTGHARGLSATTRRSTESATRSNDASTGSSTSGASPPAMIAGQYASWPSSTSHAQCSGGHECRFVLGLLDACMPAWKREDFTPADAGADFTPVQGLVAVGPGDLADLEWFVMLNRYNRPESPDWRLFVGLTYF